METRTKFPTPARLAVICLAVLGLLALALPANARQNPSRLTQTARQEIQLMKRLIDQEQAALELALLGDQKTSDTAVKAFCQAYATRMQQQQQQLQGWLQTWYQVTYTPRPRDFDEDDELILLEGDAFTQELLGALVGVHNRGIAFEKQANKRGYHADFKAMALAASRLDRQEVIQLKGWLRLYDDD